MFRRVVPLLVALAGFHAIQAAENPLLTEYQIKAAFLYNFGKSVELQGLRKNGSIFPLDLSLSTWNLGSNTFYGGIIRDISERKQTYEQLKLLANKLERSNRELQAFAYVASHDPQEPLRKVQAFGDRLKATASGILSEGSRDYLSRMLNAAKRM